jgi:hypothetical protein
MDENQEIMEKMRMIRDKREREIFETNQEDNKEISVEEVRYIGKMEFMEEIDGAKKMVEKDIFMLREINDGVEYLKMYDEDMNLLGVEIPETNQTLATEKALEKDSKMAEKLKNMNRKGRTLEELEKENNKKDKNKEISEDLSPDGEDLQITYYRPIIDKTFKSEFAETCQGAREIGMAYSEKLKSYILVAKYQDKFEIAKGTEPAKATMKQVYSIDREKQEINKESPKAIMPISGNGYKNGTKELSVTIGQYGYIETQVVDVSRENVRIGKDIQEQGESTKQEKTTKEKEQEKAWGTENTENEVDLIEDENNPDVDKMKQRIIDNIIEKYEDDLNSLYRGNEEEIQESIQRRIQKAVDKGKITEEEIQKSVELDIEEDINFDRGDMRGRPDPRNE